MDIIWVFPTLILVAVVAGLAVGIFALNRSVANLRARVDALSTAVDAEAERSQTDQATAALRRFSAR